MFIFSRQFDCGFLLKLQQLIFQLLLNNVIIIDLYFIPFLEMFLSSVNTFRNGFSRIKTLKITTCPRLWPLGGAST